MNNISPMAFVHPDAKLGDNNEIGPFCYIDADVVLGDNNKLYNSVTLHQGARIGNGNEFFPGASISTKPQDLKFKGETISRGTASRAKTVVGSNNLLMENMHIAHDCIIGSGCIIGNSTKIAGEVEIDDNAIISATVLCHQFCRIGGYVMIQGGCRFSLDIPPFIIAGKEPTRYCGINIIGLRRRGYTNEQIDIIHDTYRTIYANGIIKDGIAEARSKYPDVKEVEYICRFIEDSKRGVVR